MIALVLGGAECVWDDADRAYELFTPDVVYACKEIGVRWPGNVHCWCTLHPERMARMLKDRQQRGHPPAHEVVAPPVATESEPHGISPKHANAYHLINRTVPYKYNPQDCSPSSGVYAAMVAVQDGYHAVLAGIPLTAEGGHLVRRRPWEHAAWAMKGFRHALPHLKAKVRSMSGATRHMLGEPTPDWLATTKGPIAGAA